MSSHARRSCFFLPADNIKQVAKQTLILLLVIATTGFCSGFSSLSTSGRARINATGLEATTKSSTILQNASDNEPVDVDYDVVVIGGGIVGLATAVGLVERNIPNVKVYEKATELKPIGALLGLFPNGFAALEGISPSVAQQVLNVSLPYKGNIRHDFEYSQETGKSQITQTIQDTAPANLGTNQALLLVWYLLQDILAKSILPKGIVSLGNEFESYSVDPSTGIVSICTRNRADDSKSTTTCRILVGADGIRSKVRDELLLNQCNNQKASLQSQNSVPLQFHNRIMYRALIDMDKLDPTIISPPEGMTESYRCGEAGKVFAFRESAKRILTFTATVVVSREPTVMAGEGRKDRLRAAFAQYPDQVQHILDSVQESSIYENCVYDIDEVLSEWSNGPVVVIGDAAHAVTPAFGQGTNIGLESACDLVDEISNRLVNENDELVTCSDTISKCLKGFWEGRLDRVKEIHSFSRRRAIRRNTEPTQRTFTGVGDDDEDTFYERLYSWLPVAKRKSVD